MQARSERTRRRLVQGGAEVFDRNGYANATLGEITGAAGVTKGALYFHFPSKDELADAVQEQGSAMLQDFVREKRETDTPPVQTLIDMTHWLVHALHAGPVLRAGFRIAGERAGRRPRAPDFRREWTTETSLLLDRARSADGLNERLPEGGPETLVLAATCGVGVLSCTGMPYSELRGRVGALWQTLLVTLVPPEHAPRYRTHPPDTLRDPAGTE